MTLAGSSRLVSSGGRSSASSSAAAGQSAPARRGRRCARSRTRPAPARPARRPARPRPAGRSRAGAGRRSAPRLVFQSTTRKPSVAVACSAYTASMRPRTTCPASTSANGGSTATGVRSANAPCSNGAISSRRSSSSSMPGSPRPGSSSGSTSSCWPNRASTQAWKRVPNRAAGDGCRGIGRASSRGEPSGSSRSRASAVADRLRGQGHVDVLGAVAPGLGQQPLELGVPLGDPGGLDHVERPSSASGRRRPGGRGDRLAPARRPAAGARPRRRAPPSARAARWAPPRAGSGRLLGRLVPPALGLAGPSRASGSRSVCW